MKAKPILRILIWLVALFGVLLLPACREYAPQREPVLVLSGAEVKTVDWGDLTQDGVCRVDDVRARLGETSTDVWASDRGNKLVVLSSAACSKCYLEETSKGLYTLRADPDVSFESLDNVFVPLPSVDALGGMGKTISVTIDGSERQFGIKDFCVGSGLWEYVSSGVTHREYKIECYHRKTLTLSAFTKGARCVIELTTGESIDASVEGDSLIYWYHGDVCILGREGTVSKVVFSQTDKEE